MKKRFIAIQYIFLIGFTAAVPFSFAQPAPPPNVDAYVKAVQEAFEVPGVALAIVTDGQVVLAKGYGVREMGKPGPVDAQTLFGIASNTKAFTATALGMLVEEGKLAWDDLVVKYLPWFQLSDPYVTRNLTVRDLLVHRSGLSLGAGDLLWWPHSTLTREEIARRLRYIPLATTFRGTYAYDNVLYILAGELVEAVSGQTWEEFVQSRILDPLGMSDSVVRASRAGEGGNVATPHAPVEGAVRPVPPFLGDNSNPAAGIMSNARDIAKWMIVQLDSGRVAGGKRIFTPETTEELWTLVTPMPIGDAPPGMAPLEANFRGYALGFEVRGYRGHKLVTHTGGLPGYVSKVTLIPALDLGIAVFTNQESGAAFSAITYHILDHYLGASDADWLAAYRALDARGDSTIAALERDISQSRNTESRPSLALERYAGTYTDPWYGDVIITENDGELEIRFEHTPWLVGDLEHWNYDTFVARWDDRTVRADAFVTFHLNPDGTIDQIKMQPVSPATDFSFDFQDLVLEPAQED